MACSEGSQFCERSDESCDSMTVNVDETEFTPVPIDHSTPVSTSVMLMNSYFDFVYAKALCQVKGTAVRKNCYGCQMNHPSQKQHDCIMITDDDEYQIDFYFEEMLKEVNEKDIIQSWEDIVRVSNISPEVIDLHKLVISSEDFLQMMKTEQWRSKMKRMVLTINRLEDRLFRSSY